MSQEMNKKAVADLFCIEDARAVCEAIGGLGLNQDDKATDEPLDYTPDNILDVTVNDNPDGMPAFPQVGQDEMDDETKAFVVDELAKQLQADGRESLSEEDLIPFAVKIKGENHISQDLVSFIDQLTSNADARLATQNTSEALPNGVATDLTNDGEGSAEPASAVSGSEALPPEAPGGLAAPADVPALDTNAEESFSLDVAEGEPAVAEDEFNLDVPEPAAEVAPEGDDTFNIEVGEESEKTPDDKTVETVGELDFGDSEETSETPADEKKESTEEDDLFSALDSMSDEKLDDGSDKEDDENKSDEVDDGKKSEESKDDKKDSEKAPETEAVTDEVNAVIEEPAVTDEVNAVIEEPVDPAIAEDDANAVLDTPVDPVTATLPETDECGDGVDDKLDCIKSNYVESIARERVRAVVESYQRKRSIAEKKALCESIVAKYKARKDSERRKNLVESTMTEKISELGDKMENLCESARAADALDAKFESILAGFKAKKESEEASRALDAKFESILAKATADKKVDDKLAAIVESVRASKTAPKPVNESTKGRKGLDARLESIIADAKKKIAAAK